MGDLKVSDESVQALDALGGNVSELAKDLLLSARSLITTYDENADGLGRHNGALKVLLESLVQFSGDEEKAKTLVRRLKLQRALIMKHIERNQYLKGKQGHG